MGEDDIEREMEEIRKQKAKVSKAGGKVDTGDAVDEMHEIDALKAKYGRKGKEEAAEAPAATEEAPAAEAPAAEERIYVVQAGDSLSKIAQEVYGKAGRWREIYEANKDQIKDPGLIRPGWKLRIP